MSEEVDNMINSLDKQFKHNKQAFEPFISHIRFPKYKKIIPNEKINFNFPVTVIVGTNGCNKTSVLQALFGAPLGQSPSKYWFETQLDKISDEKYRNRFIYGYRNLVTNNIVEVIKLRSGLKKGVDYWEPAKPQKTLDMIPPTPEEIAKKATSSSDRWDPIRKDVVYSDCKEYVSAFDLFFYHFNFNYGPNSRIKSRQSFIRERSVPLEEVIKKGLTSRRYRKLERVHDVVDLTSDECEIISKIMGENYSEIKIVSHMFYGNKDFKPSKTIWMKKNDREYSEAFAGTGEARVILLITDLYNASEKSLILIDEPEISLHPAAINNLKKYILELTAKKHHQVIITTHSPKFIKGFPPSAVKLMQSTNEGVRIQDNIDYREAFLQLGEKVDARKRLFVEDVVMQMVVDQVLLTKDEQFLKENLNVSPSPGGANNMKKRIVSAAIQDQEDCYYLFDGDQTVDLTKYTNIIQEQWLTSDRKFIDEDKIPESCNDKLGEIINILSKMNLEFPVSGNSGNKNLKELYLAQRKFLKYWRNNVFFFYKATPEQAIISLEDKEYSGDDKEYFEKKARASVNGQSVTKEERLFVIRQTLSKVTKEDDLYKNIDEVVESIKDTI